MLAVITLSLLTVVAGVPATTIDNDGCTIQMIACIFLVDSDKITSDRLAETEEGLETRCKESQPILKCLSDYAAKCPGGVLENIKTFYMDEYDTLTRVCDEKGDLRKKYLENSKCLNKYKAQTERKCGKLFEFKEAERLSKEHCVTYAETFACTYKDVEATCGKAAFDLGKELLTPVTTLMDHVCRDFQFSIFRYVPPIRRSYF